VSHEADQELVLWLEPCVYRVEYGQSEQVPQTQHQWLCVSMHLAPLGVTANQQC
jgi:hypothetical protein